MGLGDLFKPKWKHSNWEVRGKAVAMLTDPALLAEMAKNDVHEKVRGLASWMLAQIAKGGKYATVREENAQIAAIALITDQAVLADLIMNSSHSRYAIKNKNLKDEALLTDIAKNSTDTGVSEQAIERISDQALLADVAKNAEKDGTCWEAIKKITDQNHLADIGKNGDGLLRNQAVSKIKNNTLAQSIYAEIAKNDRDPQTRRKALEKVTDQTVLIDIAKKDDDVHVRMDAVENPHLTDQKVLANLGKKDDSWYVRKIAVGKLTNLLLLIEIVNNKEEHEEVRRTAASRVTDEDFLVRFVQENEDEDELVCADAVQGIRDEKFLKQLAKSDTGYYIKAAAARKLNKPGAWCKRCRTFSTWTRDETWDVYVCDKCKKGPY